MIVEVDVFDAQAQAFHDAKAAAVEDFCHEAGYAAHVCDDLDGFLMGEDDGKSFRAGGIGEVWRKLDVFLKDCAVEEEDGTQGLVGCRCCDFAFGGEVGNESADFLFTHVFGVAFVVKNDVAFDPVFVGLFGAVGVVFGAKGIADLVHEFFGFSGAGLGYVFWVVSHCISSCGYAKMGQ